MGRFTPNYVSSAQVYSGGQLQGTHNLLIVATEHDSLYAFDADSGTLYWQSSMLGSGEVPSDSRNCDDLTPEIGITATPVIDRSAGPNGTIYVVAVSKTSNSSSYFARLHAVDLGTGQDLLTPVLIQATYPDPEGHFPAQLQDGNGNVFFDPRYERNRAGLVLSNGIIYTCWALIYCEHLGAGWVISYDQKTLNPLYWITTDPDGTPIAPNAELSNGSGAGIWMSGSAPAVDSAGNLYLSTGNGPFDSTLSTGDFGQSVLKLPPALTPVTDYFTPFDYANDEVNDLDMASGGTMLLDMTDSSNQLHHLLLAAGKDSNLYVLNRDSLGEFNSGTNNVYQELPGALPSGVWGSPAYFNGSVYYGAGNGDFNYGPLQQFQFNTNAKLNPASSHSSEVFICQGGPAVSSSGNTNGIVWACEYFVSAPPVLHAYNALNLGSELYSGSAGSSTGSVKYALPTVCNGKVFFGTANSVAVFGLLNSQPPSGPQFVQGNYAVPQTAQTTLSVSYNAAQTAGNLNVVVVGWNDTTARVSSVTDTKGNVYQLAVGPTQVSGALSQSIYFAKNIAAASGGANAVKVAFSVAAAYPDIRILEYSGLDPNNPLDAAIGATGSSTTSASGNLTTRSATDLLIGANIVAQQTTGPGTGFTQRFITNPDGDIAEDRVVTAIGSYGATAPVSGGAWVMQAVAFVASGQAPPPPPGPQYVQGNYAVPQSPQTTVSVPYNAAQTAGDLSVVNVGWNDTTARVSAVTDSKGNVYQLAVGPTLLSDSISQSIYYAKNIAAATAGANAVKVAFSVAAAYPDIRILEYSGINPTNPLDMAVGVTGNSGTSNSGNLATSNATHLLVGANIVQQNTTGPGANFTQRLLTNPDGDIAEDRVVTTTGSYSATAPVSGGGWVMQLAAFRSSQ